MAQRPSLPADYSVPTVWTEPANPGGAFGSINKPTAGARSEKQLPIGSHPIQLYSLGTPNGQKVTIMLEELGIEYDAFLINITKEEQFTTGFVEINPNSKIPAMVDYSNKQKPIRVFESCAILLYLAEKYNKFIPKDPAQRVECLNWLFWQAGSAPFIGGGFGHFYKYAPIAIEYAINRYSMETKRLLDVLDKHLHGKQFICGQEYTIADISIYTWFLCIDTGYNAAEFLSLNSYENVCRWMSTIYERDAVKRGLRVNGYGPDAVPERHSPADFN
jgi:GST-like protein